MAKSARTSSAVDPSPEATFKRFTWLGKRSGRGPTFPEVTQDITWGMSVVLQLLEVSDLDRVHGRPPLLSVTDAGALMRLAITSLDMLRDEAERAIESENQLGRYDISDDGAL